MASVSYSIILVASSRIFKLLDILCATLRSTAAIGQQLVNELRNCPPKEMYFASSKRHLSRCSCRE